MPYADPEKRREYARKWYAANKDRILVAKRLRQKLRYAANPQKYLEAKRRWRQAHPEYFRKYNREYRRHYIAKLRAQVLDVLGGKCSWCGLDDPRVLQADHINGGGSAERTALGYWGMIRKIISDPTGYQLLCPTCNWLKRVECGENRRGRANHENPSG